MLYLPVDSVAGNVQFSADARLVQIYGYWTTTTNNLSVNGQVVCGELGVGTFTVQHKHLKILEQWILQ